MRGTATPRGFLAGAGRGSGREHSEGCRDVGRRRVPEPPPPCTPPLGLFRSRRSVWPAEGLPLCLTCPTSGSSTWWARMRGRQPTGSSRPMSAGPQVRSPGGPRSLLASAQPGALRGGGKKLTLSLCRPDTPAPWLALGPRDQTPLPSWPSPRPLPTPLPFDLVLDRLEAAGLQHVSRGWASAHLRPPGTLSPNKVSRIQPYSLMLSNI